MNGSWVANERWETRDRKIQKRVKVKKLNRQPVTNKGQYSLQERHKNHGNLPNLQEL